MVSMSPRRLFSAIVFVGSSLASGCDEAPVTGGKPPDLSVADLGATVSDMTVRDAFGNPDACPGGTPYPCYI